MHLAAARGTGVEDIMEWKLTHERHYVLDWLVGTHEAVAAASAS